MPPCDLGEWCICITFGLNVRAENDFVSEAEMNGGMCFVHFSLRLYSDQSVLFHLVCFPQAESLI